MAHHGKKIEVDTSLGYEKNDIQLRSILVTGIALIVVCVCAFSLMWLLRNRMDAKWTADDVATANPLGLNPEQKLPPEPRLQSAPGFGVDGPNGRVNLELSNPAAEWQTLNKIWINEAKHGQKVVQNGKEIAVTLPIDEAKAQLLRQGVKTIAADEAKVNLAQSSDFYSGASSGRVASEVRR